MENIKKFYRFALVGVTKSGKTCILGRLADGADGSSRFSSTLVPPSDSSKGSSNQDGFDKILEAQQALKKNRCPIATERQSGHLQVSFDITDKQRGEYRIVTEDYAGELINPDELKDERSQASSLKKRLGEYDGLIFVVETVCDQRQLSQAEQYIQNLCSFFSGIKDEISEERWNKMPFAVVLSKWDKYSSPIDFNHPNEENSRMSNFLKEYSYPENLIKRLRAITNGQDADDINNIGSYPLSPENTKIFPVSAFGKNQCVDGDYLPQTSKAFNLIEPFAWMVERVDEIKRLELEKKGSSLAGLVNINHNFRVMAQCSEALKRIPKTTFNGQRIADVWKCAFFKGYFINILLYIALAWSAVFGLLFTIDTAQLTHLKELVASPKSSYEEINKEELKIQQYFNSDWRSNEIVQYIRLAKHVEKDMNSVTDSYYESLWKRVLDAKTIEEQYNLAKEYLTKRPNDKKHKNEAQGIIDKYEGQLVDKIEIEKSDEAIVHMCDDFLKNYPNSASSDRVVKIRNEAILRLDFEKAKNAYTALYGGHEYQSLLNNLNGLLTKWGEGEDRCAPLVREFPEHYKKLLERDAAGKDDPTIVVKYNEAISLLEGLISSVVKPELKEVLNACKSDLTNQRNIQVQIMDENLYNEVRKNPSETNMKNYLDKMNSYPTIAKMADVVKKRQQWLLDQNTPQDYKIQFTACWGDHSWDRIIKVEIWIDSNLVHTAPEILMTRNLEKPVYEATVHKTLSKDSILIRAKFIGKKDWIFGDSDGNFDLYDLLSEKEMPLKDQNGKFNWGAMIKMKITNAPDAPELPPYPKTKKSNSK